MGRVAGPGAMGSFHALYACVMITGIWAMDR